MPKHISVSLIGEMQIKTTIAPYLRAVRMAKIKKKKKKHTASVGKDGGVVTLCTLVGMQTGEATVENCREFP